jgi:hypothetical protein
MGLRLQIEDDRVRGPVKNWRERAEETGLPW